MYTDITELLQNDVQSATDLEITVDDASSVHVIQSKYDLTGVETNLVLKESAVL